MRKLDVDVVVVGGGAAGLAAAGSLQTLGLSIALIEARDRLGGRILTEFGTPADLPIELGAEFIHGRHPAAFEFARKAGLSLTEVEGVTYLDSGNGLKPLSEGEREITALLSSAEMGRRDESFHEFASRAEMSEESKHWAESYVEGFNAADARLISTRALLHQQRAEERVDGDRTWRVDSGYSQLVEKLAVRCNKIQMLTATVARKVTWSKGSVEIEAELQDGDVLLVHARAGIITLPAGVLRRDSVEWEPRPQKLEALQAFEMGHVVRVNFVLKEPVWQDVAPDADFLLSDAPHFPTWWYRCSPSGQLITGWNGGPKASALVGLPRESLFELALDTLSKLFHKSPDYLRARIVSSHFHNWSTDEFSGGAYTYVRAGGFAQSQQMDSPEEDTLWFAGEAAAVEGYWGTVHGAIDSGWRAARSVAAKLFKP